MFDAYAEELRATPSPVATNRVRQQQGVIIPIISAHKVSQLEDNLSSLDFKLCNEHMHRIDEVGVIDLGFPMIFYGAMEFAI